MLQKLSIDVLYFILQDLQRDLIFGPQSMRSLTQVCRVLREICLPFAFQSVVWEYGKPNTLPENILPLVMTFNVVCNANIHMRPEQINAIHSMLDSLKNVKTMVIYGQFGQNMARFIHLLPSLRVLELEEVPLRDKDIVYEACHTLTTLTYRMLNYQLFDRVLPYNFQPSGMSPPGSLVDESQYLSRLIIASAASLTYLKIQGPLLMGNFLDYVPFPSLHTLIVSDFVYGQRMPSFSHLVSMQHTPRLRFLHMGSPRKFYLRFALFPASVKIVSLPPLERLCIHNLFQEDKLLQHLPRTLIFLSLIINPLPDDRRQHEDPEYYYNLPDFQLPYLTGNATLKILSSAGLHQLVELRLAIRGNIEPEWLIELTNALPSLQVLELHHWSPFNPHKSLDDFLPAIYHMSGLSEIRLDMHLSDEVRESGDNNAHTFDLQASESSGTSQPPTPYTWHHRAQKLARNSSSKLAAFGFLKRNYWYHPTSTKWVTPGPGFWLMYDIIRDEDTKQAFAQERMSFHPFQYGWSGEEHLSQRNQST